MVGVGYGRAMVGLGYGRVGLWVAIHCGSLLPHLLPREQHERSHHPCHYDVIQEVTRAVSIPVIAK